MTPDSLQRASVFACVSVVAVAAALVLGGDPRWLAYPLLVVGGAAFLPAVVGLVVWWTGIDVASASTGGRWINTLMTVIVIVALLLTAYNGFVLGLTRGWTDELQLFAIGVYVVGIILFGGRIFGLELLLGET